MKHWITSEKTHTLILIIGLVWGICVGSTFHLYRNEKLPNPFQLDSPFFIAYCIALIMVLPCFVPFFKAIRALQFQIEHFLFDRGKNEEIRQTRSDPFRIFLKLFFLFSFYSSFGLIISSLWTEWSVAILGGALLIGSFIALKVLGHENEAQKNTCDSREK